MKRLFSALSVLMLSAGNCLAAPPGPGFHARVSVSEPTRLDWTFVLSNRSLPKAPANWLGEYESKKQTYELFVPQRKNAKAPMPLLLYLSPADEPNGFKTFEAQVKAHGMLYAAPRVAGNGVDPKKRVRIVLDVLDDLRRHYPIDPDRTYITGFSGGGRIACAVAFALPELFGGVMPICASGDVRQESWLRQRVSDRLSVALLTGEKDFNRGEVERLRGPYLSEVGVRTKVWNVSGMGHTIPGSKIQGEALAWMESDVKRRQALAKAWPASRYSETDREAQAKALLAEGRKRLAKSQTLYSGLMQVKGVMERWPDLDHAKEATKLLEEYDGKKEKPWEADDIAEQRRFLAAGAKALDRYAMGPLDARYQKQKPQMIAKAIEMYRTLIKDNPDSDAAKEAKKRLAVLEKE